MADINPPVGEGGAEGLSAAAKKAALREETGVIEAKKSVASVEASADEVKALRRRLTKAQRTLIDAVGRGETPALGRNAGSTLKSLQRAGILRETGDGGRDLTTLGRQVAGLERVAAKYAIDTGKAVTRGLARGRLKVAPELSAEQTKMMQEYLRGGRHAAEARRALQSAGIVGDTSFIGKIERDRFAPRQPGAASTPTFGSAQWVKQLREAMARPGFNTTLDRHVQAALSEGTSGGPDFLKRVEQLRREGTPPKITYASNAAGREAEAAAKRFEKDRVRAEEKADADARRRAAAGVRRTARARARGADQYLTPIGPQNRGVIGTPVLEPNVRQVLSEMPAELRRVQVLMNSTLAKGVIGGFTPTTNTVQLRPGRTLAQTRETLAHELYHANTIHEAVNLARTPAQFEAVSKRIKSMIDRVAASPPSPNSEAHERNLRNWERRTTQYAERRPELYGRGAAGRTIFNVAEGGAHLAGYAASNPKRFADAVGGPDAAWLEATARGGYEEAEKQRTKALEQEAKKRTAVRKQEATDAKKAEPAPPAPPKPPRKPPAPPAPSEPPEGESKPPKRPARKTDVRPVVGDDEAALHKAAAEHAAAVESSQKRAADYAKRVAEGRAPAIDSAEFQRKLAAEKAADSTKEKILAKPTPPKPPAHAEPPKPPAEPPKPPAPPAGGGKKPPKPPARPPAPPTPPEPPPEPIPTLSVKKIAQGWARGETIRLRAIAQAVEREALKAQEQFLTSIGGTPTGDPAKLVKPGSAGRHGPSKTEWRREAARLAREAQVPSAPAGPDPAFLSRIGGYPGDVGGKSYGPGTGAGKAKFNREVERGLRDEAKAGKLAAAANAELQAKQALVAETGQRVAASQEGVYRGFQHAAVGERSASQAMTRHGYLTSEAIEAARRGELTYRQWGQQIGGTAAKFAGWTAVSIPVFAALSGVQKIGEGAIASASGVQSLQRYIKDVDGERLQEQFRGLAGHFNVPIDQVSEAVARMGQVFKDQDSAVAGATAVLYSFKTGGVAVEAGAKNLTAIINGFKLSGEEIGGVFDQINQAQNLFSVSINDTEAGVAKAAGTFANAGGSLSFLLALIATGKLSTGRTGENIGTAVQRSIGFIGRPKNQADLRSFGIDPSKGIESVYTQAFQVAQRLQGKELHRLAEALSSPQYASYFVPILQNSKRFQDIQAGTSPAASAGSAQRELHTVTSQLDQQIAKIGVDLQQLGSNLNQGGFLSGLELAVGALDKLLTLANSLLTVFNGLPGPLKTGLALLLQARGAVGLLRRVGFGEGRKGPLAPYLIETAGRRERRAVEKGLGSGVQAARDEHERLTKDARRAAAERYVAHDVYRQVDADVSRRGLSEAEALEARALASQRVEAAEQASLAATYRANASLKLIAEAEAQGARYRDAIAAAPRGGRSAAALAFSRAEGLSRPATLESPTSLAPIGGGQGVTPGGVVIPAGTRSLDDASTVVAKEEAKRVRDQLRKAGTSVGELRATSGIPGVVRAGGAAAVAASKSIAAALKASAIGIVGMVGPLGLLLGGVFIGLELLHKHSENVRKAKELADRQIATAHADVQGDQDFKGDPSRLAADRQRRQLERDRAQLADRGEVLIPGTNRVAPVVGTDTEASRENAKAIQRLRDQRGQQIAAQKAGGLVPFLTREGINQRVDRDFKAAEDGILTFKELRAHIAQRLKELPLSRLPAEQIQPTAEAIRRRLQALAPTSKTFAQQLYAGSTGVQGIPVKRLTEPLPGLEALTQSGVASKLQVREYTQIQLAIIARNRGKKDPDSQVAYAQAVTQLQQTLRAAAAIDKAQALAVAKTEADKERIYQEYSNSFIDSASAASIGVLKAKLAAEQEQLRTDKALRRSARAYGRLKAAAFQSIADTIDHLNQTLPGLFGSPISGPPTPSQGEIDANNQVGADKRNIKDTQRAIDKLRQGKKQQHALSQKAVDDAAAAAPPADDGVQEAAALIQAQADLAQAHGVEGAQIAGMRRLIAFYQAHKDVFKPSQIVSLQAQLVRAINQRVKDNIEGLFALRESRTDNPVEIAKLEAQKARRLYNAGGFESAADRGRAKAEVNTTLRAKRNAVLDRKVDDIKFDQEIGRISTQQEIAALEGLLRTTKAGKEAKRNLRREILRLKHDLSQESELDLNVGSIRLPTTYEIRRFVKGAQQGINVTQSYTTHVQVSRDVDVSKVASAHERYYQQGGKAIARAAGHA